VASVIVWDLRVARGIGRQHNRRLMVLTARPVPKRTSAAYIWTRDPTNRGHFLGAGMRDKAQPVVHGLAESANFGNDRASFEFCVLRRPARPRPSKRECGIVGKDAEIVS